MTTLYFICFIISIGITIFYFLNLNKHFNVCFTLSQFLIPLVCFGCWRLSISENVQEAFLSTAIIYLGGCFLLPLAGLGIAYLGKVKFPKWLTLVIVAVSLIIYLSVVSTEYTGFFYTSTDIDIRRGSTVLVTTNGFMHTVFYIVLALYAVLSICVIIYCLKNSRKSSLVQMIPISAIVVICIISFLISHMLIGDMEPTVIYCLTQLVIAIISLRTPFYYADDFVMSTITGEGAMGCMTFSLSGKALGWNNTVEAWFPELEVLKADRHPVGDKGILAKFDEWFDTVDRTGKPVQEILKSGNKSILITVRDIELRRHVHGYCVSMRDDTAQQQLMEIMQKNSEQLIEQVFTKNESISKLSRTFEHYVDPSIMNEIINGADIDLAGKEKDIVVLFADIRGFTTLTESSTPEETLHILNSTFELMTKCVMDNHGTLDKFIGDCIMAFWNAPVPQEDSAYLACKTAKEILAGLPGLNMLLGFPEGNGISIGIGLCAGPATVGNIGTSKRMDYTAVGDTVNTASRLQDLAPANTIYISQSVTEKVDKRVKYTSVAKDVKLKGKSNALEIFTLDYVGEE